MTDKMRLFGMYNKNVKVQTPVGIGHIIKLDFEEADSTPVQIEFSDGSRCWFSLDDCTLQLRSIDTLTDDEKVKWYDVVNESSVEVSNSNKLWVVNNNFTTECLRPAEYMYLLSLGYSIPNAYAAPVKSAEEVLSEVYGLGHRGTYTKEQVIKAMQSYASQPIGKGAEIDWQNIRNIAESIEDRGITADHAMQLFKTCFIPPTTPTTDWDKVTAEQCADDLEISLIDVRSVFEYLKQHIGAGERVMDEATLYGIIREAIRNGVTDTDKARKATRAILAHSVITTAPASEQVDFTVLTNQDIETITDGKYPPNAGYQAPLLRQGYKAAIQDIIHNYHLTRKNQ